MKVIATKSLGFMVGPTHHVVHPSPHPQFLHDDARHDHGFPLCIKDGSLRVIEEADEAADEPKSDSEPETSGKGKAKGKGSRKKSATDSVDSSQDEAGDEPKSEEGGE
jgi:hypothetical protein